MTSPLMLMLVCCADPIVLVMNSYGLKQEAVYDLLQPHPAIVEVTTHICARTKITQRARLVALMQRTRSTAVLSVKSVKHCRASKYTISHSVIALL
jgi:hypothetical protein